jgi:hypothetical protein
MSEGSNGIRLCGKKGCCDYKVSVLPSCIAAMPDLHRQGKTDRIHPRHPHRPLAPTSYFHPCRPAYRPSAFPLRADVADADNLDPGPLGGLYFPSPIMRSDYLYQTSRHVTIGLWCVLELEEAR